MQLIRQGEVVSDSWIHVTDGDELPDSRPAIVSLDRWKGDRDSFLRRNAPIGVRLRSDQRSEDIAPDVNRFSVIALEFPTFKDGRSYSTARLLRERHGYSGELRAVGNVLRDQLPLMARCGFDAFEVEKDTDAEAPETGGISIVYQRGADARAPIHAVRSDGAAGASAY